MSQKLAFVINVYEEPAAMVEALRADLSKAYPEAFITTVKDGPVRLKTPATAGRWISRYLDWGMAPDPDWLIKIDPDAKVIRPIFTPFTGDVSCAKKTFKLKREHFMPHTGVIAYSRAAALALRAEALQSKYENFPGTRDDYQEEILVKEMCAELGLKITDRTDFQCGLRRMSQPNPLATFSHR